MCLSPGRIHVKCSLSHQGTPVALLLAGIVLLLSLCTSRTLSWGSDVHRFINRNAVYHLPGEMAPLVQDSTFLALHSVDADGRKISGDTSLFAEAPRHYLDIDDYPDFRSMPRNLDSVIALYGLERVKQNGTLPWATALTYDSLVAQLSRGEWDAALLTASDLGHYVADAHQPLHCAVNYNGQLTNNFGIHSRYESTMLSSTYYLSWLSITPDSVRYVPDPLGYAFEYIIRANGLLDTILVGDTYAKNVSGWGGSGTAPASYYTALWERTRRMTLDQLQRGTEVLASLWYSAWIDAGLLSPTTVKAGERLGAERVSLFQNYPNPFNPTTVIPYQVEEATFINLAIYDLLGNRVSVLVNERMGPGNHRVTWEPEGISGGMYVCRLQAGSFVQIRKLILLR